MISVLTLYDFEIHVDGLSKKLASQLLQSLFSCFCFCLLKSRTPWSISWTLSLPITAVLSVSKFYLSQSNTHLLRFKVIPSIFLTLTSFWLHQDFWSIDSNSSSLLFNTLFSLLFLLNINFKIIYLITPLHSPISPLFYHTPLQNHSPIISYQYWCDGSWRETYDRYTPDETP